MAQSKIQLNALNALKEIDPHLEINWSKNRSTPNRLRGRFTKPAEENAETIAINFVNAHKDLFPLASPETDLFLKGISIDKQGGRHVHYQQLYQKIPVFGSELIVHLDNKGVVQGLNGKIISSIDLDIKPEITENDVAGIIKKDDANNEVIPGKKPLLLILIKENKPFLAWHLSVNGTDKNLVEKQAPALWEYFVNAKSGEILWRYNNLQSQNPAVGDGVGYYAGAVIVNSLHNHATNEYELIDRSLPTQARVQTYDCNNGTPPGVISTDPDNHWNAANQGIEVDCHVFSRMVYDYYYLVHGRNSYDGAGADMYIYAHYLNNENNAYWSPSIQGVKMGDGDGVTYDPFCSLDIIAHEWTHAVTEYTAGLIYQGESGALNESMSDVFASLIDADWLIGEDIWLAATAPALRNMEDPTNGGQYDPANPIASVIDGHQPDHTDDQYTGFADHGGVHINSGILNKAAQLIATGGTHRGIHICEGLGRDVLGRLYYHALTNHLISTSDFFDMRDAVLDSLWDLYSTSVHYARWRASIINAFAAVGIGDPVTCPISCWSAPVICAIAPSVCTVAPSVCTVAPSACLLAPSACPVAPAIQCPPSPTICPVAPVIGCQVAPIIGCLPGPDPVPFDFRERILPEFAKKDIIEIAGIGEERANLLRKQNINTIEDLAKATTDTAAIQNLANKTGLSQKRVTNWSLKAKALIRE